MKWNIPRHLTALGCRRDGRSGQHLGRRSPRPRSRTASSSRTGPGDPRPLVYAVETIRDLLGKKPIFGICLGHQLLGLACGGKMFKLKFGHRGGNQPVLDRRNDKVEITSQNHGFALEADSFTSNVEVTHINLNDQTVEGIRHRDVPPSACSTTPKPRPARTTATICSANSAT